MGAATAAAARENPRDAQVVDNDVNFELAIF
jgi:hypothetical protein